MLLRTNARDGEPRGTQPPEKRLEGGHQPSLGDQIEHLRECPCYLHRHPPMPLKSAGPCICECDHTGDPGELMPTPRAGDGEKGGPNQRGSSGDLMLPSAVTLLPAPDSSPENYRLGGDSQQSRSLPAMAIRGELDGSLLPTPAVMLPTPSVADGEGGHETRSGARSHERLLPGVAKYELLPTTTTKDAQASGAAGYGGNEFCTLTDATVRQPSRWGKYAAAIARWEAITRPAPEPTNVTDGYLKARAKRLARLDKRPVGMRGSLKVRRQLAARFSEWMMGVPLGWITDVPGITRNEALKAAGNGVVPQQAAEALRFLLAMPTGREIADAHEPDDLLELLAVAE